MSRVFPLSLISVLLLAACSLPGAGPAADTSDEQTILENAMEFRNLTTFVGAVKAAGLTPTLNSSGPFTVFAPSNDAFDALPGGALESLLHPENQEVLNSILTYHIVPGPVAIGDLQDGEVLTTIHGARLKVKVMGEEVWIDDTRVGQADVASSNGLLHVVSAVLFPEAVAGVGATEGKEGEEREEIEAIEEIDEIEEEVREDPQPAPAAASATYAAYREGVIGGGEPVVLFFHASWCPFCKANDARLQSWYGEGLPQVSTYKIDYDTAVDLKQRFGVVQQDTYVKLDGAGNVLGTISFPSESELKGFVGA